MSRILVADDHLDVLEALRILLKTEGYETVQASSPRAVLEAVKSASPFDLILIDLNYTRDTTSGREGLELLERVKSEAPVIVMTAWGNVPLAVEAMRLGACDFVEKPWENDRLLLTVKAHINGNSKHASSPASSRDLEVARAVQQRLLPQTSPPLATLDYAGKCLPAGHVGGDYYDFLPLGSGEMGFVVADVSGKGVSAAILMANLQAHFRSQYAGAFDDLRTLFKDLNQRFYDSSPSEHYATAFFGRYCDRTRRLQYVNCGHNPPVLVRRDGPVERLNATATVLGLFPRWDCEIQQCQLASGDTLVMFSDGVTEAIDEREEEFGEARLIEMLQGKRQKPIAAIVDDVLSAIRAHQFGAQADDITALGLQGRSA